MERKIGEIFEYNGDWYQCVEQSGCGACSFRKNDTICHSLGCSELVSRDSTPVIFKKLEKNGEPFEFGGVIVQSYKVDKDCFPILPKGDDLVLFRSYTPYKVYIEIKQTKEDMEEKKQDVSKTETTDKRMRPFDLDAARSGKPVCTRDGRKARIICFDRKSETPITVLVTEINGIEAVYSYPNNGIWDSPENTNGCDLMMLPEKKEMWINIYKGTTGPVPGGCLYDTEEEAKDSVKGDENYVTTIKICWEE